MMVQDVIMEHAPSVEECMAFAAAFNLEWEMIMPRAAFYFMVEFAIVMHVLEQTNVEVPMSFEWLGGSVVILRLIPSTLVTILC